MRGYTLMEMTIVVLVIAIAAGIALPMLGNSNTGKLRAAADVLAADIAYAQSESIAHGDNLRLLVVDADHHGYRIATQNDPNTPVTDPVTHQPYQVVFGQGTSRSLGGVTITATHIGGDDQLGFGALGQLDQTDPATFTLTAGTSCVTVSVDPNTGETTIGDIH